MKKLTLLDLYCGVGGWSSAFLERGVSCVGVDIVNFPGYPGEFLQADVFSLSPQFIDSFDFVIASPPCDDFARAHLPWLRGDKNPSNHAMQHLQYSVSLCNRPGRLTECSRFAAKHLPGSSFYGSFALWGDLPLLCSDPKRNKASMSGKRPDLRAKIPYDLANAVCYHFISAQRNITNKQAHKV